MSAAAIGVLVSNLRWLVLERWIWRRKPPELAHSRRRDSGTERVYQHLVEHLLAIKNWETEAHKAWFTGNGAPIQESPRNFQAGFLGTWANNRSLLLTDTESGTIYRIIQSGLSAWWLVMARCVAAGLDAGIAREWLDRAEGRHYADTLVDAVLGAEVGPFEFQARSLQQAFEADPRVDPVLCMTGDPDSASVHADRMIGNVIDDLKNRPRTRETPQQVH